MPETVIDVVFDEFQVGSPTPADIVVPEPVLSVITVEGPPGPQGLPGTGAPIVGELPGGVKDGVNLVFTTANAFAASSLALYRNGLREQRSVGFTETGATEFTLTTAPEPSDDLSVDYYIV